ncbi:MAG: lasso peptide biosynthesis B2 protein [bacterium]
MRRREAAPHGGTLSAAVPLAWRLRAITAAAVIPPLLEVMSLARLERILRSIARVQLTSAPSDAASAWWVDHNLDRWPGPWRRTCLRRAAVLYYLLRSSGRAVELCIGVRRDEHGELLAHAWLLRDGALYVEPSTTTEVVSEYTMIARFPGSIAHTT